MIDQMQAPEAVKQAIDVVSMATAVGALTQILPPLAAILTIIWTSLRIYDWVVNKKRDRDGPKD